jgi:hypothetical protein
LFQLDPEGGEFDDGLLVEHDLVPVVRKRHSCTKLRANIVSVRFNNRIRISVMTLVIESGNDSKALYSQHHGHSHIPRLESHILR